MYTFTGPAIQSVAVRHAAALTSIAGVSADVVAATVVNGTRVLCTCGIQRCMCYNVCACVLSMQC